MPLPSKTIAGDITISWFFLYSLYTSNRLIKKLGLKTISWFVINKNSPLACKVPKLHALANPTFLFSSIGLIFKTISNDDIDYSDGKINNIEGIIIKKNNIIIDTNIYNFETMVVQQTQQKKKLSDFWDKYINNIKT